MAASRQGALSGWEVDELRRAFRRGMTAPQLAERYHVATRTIWRYLRADRYGCAHCDATFPTSALAWEHAVQTRYAA